MANALFLLGRQELIRGERAAAGPLFMEGLACAEAVGDRWVESLIQLWLAQMAFDDGDQDAARAWAERVLAGGEAAGWHRNACFALRVLGDVEARQGNAERARTLLEASLAHGREVGRWLAAWPATNLGHLLIEQHDHPRARVLLREALISYRDAGDREGMARCLDGWARLAACGGLAAHAVRLAGAAVALRSATGTALPVQERIAFERHTAAARATLGVQAADAAWAAGQSLTPAQAAAEALALPEWANLDRPEAAPVRTNPLTPREREVAALVARGLSNRAIAQELVITEATAERHIGNVFAKLGLTSRAQLAVWAVEHGLLRENP
jgi:ATP/maltotriose-dependent transcriptional regulator MalT